MESIPRGRRIQRVIVAERAEGVVRLKLHFCDRETAVVLGGIGQLDEKVQCSIPSPVAHMLWNLQYLAPNRERMLLAREYFLSIGATWRR